MKNLLTLTCIFTLFLGFHSVQADVIIVNNNEGQPKDIENFYDNLQEAIDASEPDDTIYVVGSPNAFNTITINTNRLTLIGTGYLLGENKSLIQTQANIETAKIARLTINGNDIQITGFNFGYNLNNSITVNGQNVEIIRNRIALLSVRGNSTLVRENVIVRAVTLTTGSSNSIIRNNIFWGSLFQDFNSVGISDIEIINNTFNDGFTGVEYANVDNNIFINSNEPISRCTNNIFSHNVFTASKSVAFQDNQNNEFDSLDNIFSEAESNLFESSDRNIDRDFQLKDDSTVKRKGLGGVDPGAYSGDINSYKISGLPAVPAIYEYTIHNGVGTAETGIKVTIKAKSHN